MQGFFSSGSSGPQKRNTNNQTSKNNDYFTNTNNINQAGTIFFDRSKAKTTAGTSDHTERIYQMNQHVTDPNRFRHPFYAWLDERYRIFMFYWSFFYNKFTTRLRETAWTLVFSFCFLYFVYQLCFVAESQRISNENAKLGAFIMAIFLLLSTLKETKLYKELDERAKDK